MPGQTVRQISKEGTFRSLIFSAATLVSPLTTLIAPGGFSRAAEHQQGDFGSKSFGTSNDWLQKQAELDGWGLEKTRTEVLDYLESVATAADLRESLLKHPALSEAVGEGKKIESLAGILSITDGRAKALCEAMNSVSADTTFVEPLPEAEFLLSDDIPELVAMVLKQHYGNWLVRHRLYEPALKVLQGLEAASSPDPQQLLFNQLVTQHQLLHSGPELAELALATSDQLLHDTRSLPRRYEILGTLMLADVRQYLKNKEQEPLDEISRRMTSVSRRLELGHSNQEVVQEEQKIIDALTELIEKLEQQQQQANSSGGGQRGQQGKGQQSQGGQGRRAANDSNIAGGQGGNGDVDRKKLADRPGWGNLPPKERREAIQNISRDLPTHYREAIEAYFRKMATDQNP